MNCKDFDLYASAYIDNMLLDEEKIDFENHINKCENCKVAFQNLKIIVESTNNIEEVELPQNFSNELRQKLEVENTCKSQNKFSDKIKILTSIVAGLLVTVMSLSLLNNYLVNQNMDKQMDIARAERNNNTKQNSEFKTESEELTQEPKVAPKTMSIESFDENNEAEIDNATASENKVKAPGEIPKENNIKIINSVITSILVLGIGFFIYRFLRR